MPEWAEVRLMADYINRKCKNKQFSHVLKNKINKQEFDVRELPYPLFEIKAVARGKELQIQHMSVSPNLKKTANLTITLGMSGNFSYVTGNVNKWPMLTWFTIPNPNPPVERLELIDHRRFAKWKFRNWNPDRGPDIVTEHDEFKKLIKQNILIKNKKFQKPLCELLMDQRFFNGIGNYLLAEILGRLNVNPFQSILKLSKSKINRLLKLCYQIPTEAYVLGGGQIKDWKNQNNVSAKDFKKWLRFYQHKNSNSVITETGRNFWYHKKWHKYCIYESD